MIRPPPRSTRTDTLFPYTTLFRSHLALVGGDGAGIRRQPLAGLQQDLSFRRVARDPVRRPPRHDPRGKGRGDRAAPGIHHRLRPALRALLVALPDGALLDTAVRALSLRLHPQ